MCFFRVRILYINHKISIFQVWYIPCYCAITKTQSFNILKLNLWCMIDAFCKSINIIPVNRPLPNSHKTTTKDCKSNYFFKYYFHPRKFQLDFIKYFRNWRESRYRSRIFWLKFRSFLAMHAYVQACMHTYRHACIHTGMHAYIQYCAYMLYYILYILYYIYMHARCEHACTFVSIPACL